MGYLNTRDPRSIVRRLKHVNHLLDNSWEGFFTPERDAPFETWRGLVSEARALETILSRWVLIFPVGEDPPQLY